MKIVYKYELRVDASIVHMTKGAEVLKVELQGTGDVPCMWVLEDPDEKVKEERRFEIYGTGHPMSEKEYKYIGTVFPDYLVFHVFEVL